MKTRKNRRQSGGGLFKALALLAAFFATRGVEAVKKPSFGPASLTSSRFSHINANGTRKLYKRNTRNHLPYSSASYAANARMPYHSGYAANARMPYHSGYAASAAALNRPGNAASAAALNRPGNAASAAALNRPGNAASAAALNRPGNAANALTLSTISNATEILLSPGGVSTIITDVLESKKNIRGKTVSQLFGVAPHNTLTIKSRKLPIIGQATTSNQFMSQTEYQNAASLTGLVIEDIDVSKLINGKLVSKHGTTRFNMYCNESEGNTELAFHNFFEHCIANPEDICIARIENKDGVGPSDILGILKPEHKSRIYGWTHGTHLNVDEMISSGRNVLVFLQEDCPGIHPVTKNYEGGILPQNDFVIRTLWNDVEAITKPGILSPNHMATKDWSRIAKNGAALVMIDCYDSSTGSNTVKLPGSQMMKMKELTTITPNSVRLTAQQHGIDMTNTTGAIFMMDAVSPETICSVGLCNMKGQCEITNEEIQSMISAASEFLEQRAFLDTAIHLWENIKDNVDITSPFFGFPKVMQSTDPKEKQKIINFLDKTLMTAYIMFVLYQITKLKKIMQRSPKAEGLLHFPKNGKSL